MKQVSVTPSKSGFIPHIDGKPAKTPLGKVIEVPTYTLAERIAKEWQKQGKIPCKETMPLTQIACIALDLAVEKREEIYADILPYIDTDLVCYRSDIAELALSQEKFIDPIIAWANNALGIQLNITHDIMPVAQNPGNRQRIRSHIDTYDKWQLAMLASIVKPLSSIILAIALFEKHINGEDAFHLSHMEEEYETGKWGMDIEKEQRLDKLKQDIIAAYDFLCLMKQ